MYEGMWVLKVKVISRPWGRSCTYKNSNQIFSGSTLLVWTKFFMNALQVLYVLCFTRPRYQVSDYRTTGPLVFFYMHISLPKTLEIRPYGRWGGDKMVNTDENSYDMNVWHKQRGFRMMLVWRYVKVSVLVKFSQNTSVLTLIIISSL